MLSFQKHIPHLLSQTWDGFRQKQECISPPSARTEAPDVSRNDLGKEGTLAAASAGIPSVSGALKSLPLDVEKMQISLLAQLRNPVLRNPGQLMVSAVSKPLEGSKEPASFETKAGSPC